MAEIVPLLLMAYASDELAEIAKASTLFPSLTFINPWTVKLHLEISNAVLTPIFVLYAIVLPVTLKLFVL